MKVQIEISDMALSLAILAMKGATNSDPTAKCLSRRLNVAKMKLQK